MCTPSRLIDFETCRSNFFLAWPGLSHCDHACVKFQNETEKLQFLVNIALVVIFSSFYR